MPEHVLSLLSDAELIDRWQSRPPGRWSAGTRWLHDRIAERVAKRGCIRSGEWAYSPTEDGSFLRVPVGRASSCYHGPELGRAVELTAECGDSLVKRFGRARSL